IPELIKLHEADLLDEWIREQKEVVKQAGKIKDAELRAQCAEFLVRLRRAAQGNNLAEVHGPRGGELRELLGDVSRSRGLQGFSPSETATFIFSLKRPLFGLLRRALAKDPERLVLETWRTNELLDTLGLFTTEVYQKSREEVILRQQQEMLELSTP